MRSKSQILHHWPWIASLPQLPHQPPSYATKAASCQSNLLLLLLLTSMRHPMACAIKDAHKT
jgi:hypothetical protein